MLLVVIEDGDASTLFDCWDFFRYVMNYNNKKYYKDVYLAQNGKYSDIPARIILY